MSLPLTSDWRQHLLMNGYFSLEVEDEQRQQSVIAEAQSISVLI